MVAPVNRTAVRIIRKEISMTLVAQDLPTGLWQVDTVHSTVGFAVRHNAISLFRGSFEDYDARLDVGEDGRVELTGTVRAESIAVRDDDLAAHLAAPDFFDSERF